MRLILLIGFVLYSFRAIAQPAPQTPLHEAARLIRSVSTGSQPATFVATKTVVKYLPDVVYVGAEFTKGVTHEQTSCQISFGNGQSLEVPQVELFFIGTDGKALRKTKWTPTSEQYPINYTAPVLFKADFLLFVELASVSSWRWGNRPCEEGHYSWDEQGNPIWICDRVGPIKSYNLESSFQVRRSNRPDLPLKINCRKTSVHSATEITFGEFRALVGNALSIEF